MTQQYQNVAFSGSTSAFVDVNQKREVAFSARRVNSTVAGNPVRFVKASIVLRGEAEAPVCGNECGPTVAESIKLELSVLDGAERLTALRGELNRLLDKAISEYNFAKGLTPPVYADFTE